MFLPKTEFAIYNVMRKQNLWLDFYNKIKDPSWPLCSNEHEFHGLPDNIKKEIIDLHDGDRHLAVTAADITGLEEKSLRFNTTDCSESLPMDYAGPVECKEKFFVASDFAVTYDSYMYGYGILHCQIYPKIIKFLYPGRIFDHCLEWCAGPGFIGYRLLSDGVCRSVSFMDKYRPCLTAVQNTYLHRPERLYHTEINTIWHDKIAAIGDQKYDLVVANPPNFDFYSPDAQSTNLGRITQDPQWQVHSEFFHHISKNLTDDGVILLMKHRNGSQPIDHVDAINQGRLQISKTFQTRLAPNHYFMEIHRT